MSLNCLTATGFSVGYGIFKSAYVLTKTLFSIEISLEKNINFY